MYSKVESVKNISKLGFNRHNMIFTNSFDEAERSIKLYNYICSIRTDREGNNTKNLPFYVLNNQKEFEDIKEKLLANIKDDMILIISDGHHYDNKLLYNMVVCFDKDGEFNAEFNCRNVTLRHMYNYPNDMVGINGNINDTVASWIVNNKEHNKINIRNVGNLLNRLYEIVYDKNLYDKHLEISVYKDKCGIMNEEYVCWEI